MVFLVIVTVNILIKLSQINYTYAPLLIKLWEAEEHSGIKI